MMFRAISRPTRSSLTAKLPPETPPDQNANGQVAATWHAYDAAGLETGTRRLVQPRHRHHGNLRFRAAQDRDHHRRFWSYHPCRRQRRHGHRRDTIRLQRNLCHHRQTSTSVTYKVPAAIRNLHLAAAPYVSPASSQSRSPALPAQRKCDGQLHGRPRPTCQQHEILVAGISPFGYNGVYSLASHTSTSLTYSVGTCPGAYSSGGSVLAPATANTYDGDQDVTAANDARGNTTNSTFDFDNRQLTQTDPATGQCRVHPDLRLRREPTQLDIVGAITTTPHSAYDALNPPDHPNRPDLYLDHHGRIMVQQPGHHHLSSTHAPPPEPHHRRRRQSVGL